MQLIHEPLSLEEKLKKMSTTNAVMFVCLTFQELEMNVLSMRLLLTCMFVAVCGCQEGAVDPDGSSQTGKKKHLGIYRIHLSF